jgi:hypothetical protein
MRMVEFPYTWIHANTQNIRQREGGRVIRTNHRGREGKRDTERQGSLGKKLTLLRYVYLSSTGEGGYGAAASPGPPIESPRAQALRIHRGFACSGTNSQKYSIF